MNESFEEQGYGSGIQSGGFSLKSRVMGSFMVMLLVSLAITLATREAQAIDDLVVYDDTLAAVWQDWSYNERIVDFAATSPTYAGTHSIAVTHTGGWSGLMIGYGGGYLNVNAHDTFQFYVHGGTTGGQSIEFALALTGGDIVRTLSPQAGIWTLVELSLAGHSPGEAYSITFFNNTADAQSTFFIDGMSFRDSGTPPQPGAGPDLSVDAAAGVHPISPPSTG